MTFEKFWAGLQESRKEFDRQMLELKEQMREYREADERRKQEDERRKQEDREADERRKQEDERRKREEEIRKREADRTMDELKKQVAAVTQSIGEMSNRLGEVAEHLVAPNIAEKFNLLGYDFDEYAVNVKIKDPKTKQLLFELDILLENGGHIVVVEVKTKPTLQHVATLTQRLAVFRAHRDKNLHGEKRIIHGAIAGAVFDRKVIEAAQQSGFFVITQTGDTMQIENPKDFQPKAF